ncbi:MAG: enoyl-CoA hydratase/isomerase family protein [Desulfarculaceae bacterium]|jgi:2-(1,2-epoxy-1,2-dihydrophenyl)acetyl-CoA isomerase
MKSGDLVKTARQGRVAKVVMDNPSTLNAMDEDLGPELTRSLEALAVDSGIGSVVLSGAGGVFSAGGNLARAQAYLDEHPGQGAGPVFQSYGKWVQRVLAALTSMPQPVVCAVEGVASGAGLAWMLASDYVVVDQQARLVCGFLGVGLPPGAGISQTLPRLVGLPRAAELFMLNRSITPDRARELGLIDETCPRDQVLPRALEAARKLATGPSQAMAATKALLRLAARKRLNEQAESERQEVMHCADQPEFNKRVQRFAKNRK